MMVARGILSEEGVGADRVAEALRSNMWSNLAMKSVKLGQNINLDSEEEEDGSGDTKDLDVDEPTTTPASVPAKPEIATNKKAQEKTGQSKAGKFQVHHE